MERLDKSHCGQALSAKWMAQYLHRIAVYSGSTSSHAPFEDLITFRSRILIFGQSINFDAAAHLIGRWKMSFSCRLISVNASNGSLVLSSLLSDWRERYVARQNRQSQWRGWINLIAAWPSRRNGWLSTSIRFHEAASRGSTRSHVPFEE